MTEFLSKRRKEFFERWALVNAPILSAGLMMAGVLARLAEPGELPAVGKRMVLLGIFLVALPVNGIYLFGSAHIHVRQQWQGHRSFWLWLLLCGAAWAFAIFGAVLAAGLHGPQD
ncbi:MAG: hypothetical protein HY291_03125 [Planctomycetes bacterium]|nr:hypothetical protein [Planctomycetota bacterium]